MNLSSMLLKDGASLTRKHLKHSLMTWVNCFALFKKNMGELPQFTSINQTENHPGKLVGAFPNMVPYSDCSEFYLQEVWITVFQSQADKTHSLGI